MQCLLWALQRALWAPAQTEARKIGHSNGKSLQVCSLQFRVVRRLQTANSKLQIANSKRQKRLAAACLCRRLAIIIIVARSVGQTFSIWSLLLVLLACYYYGCFTAFARLLLSSSLLWACVHVPVSQSVSRLVWLVCLCAIAVRLAALAARLQTANCKLQSANSELQFSSQNAQFAIWKYIAICSFAR